MRITFTLVLIMTAVTIAYAQNRTAPIESTTKVREVRPSLSQLTNEVDELKQSLLELEIAVTKANTARLVERNEDFQKTSEVQNENFKKTLELTEKIGQIKSDLAAHYSSLNNPLSQLRNEFDNRGGQLLQFRRDLDDAAARVNQAEAQIREDGVSTAQQIEGLTSRLNVLEARIQSISAQHVQKTEFALREEELLTRIRHLEEANQSLLQRFQVAETLIQQLSEQISANSERLILANRDALTHLSRVEQLEAQILSLESFSDRLDILAAKDLELDRKVFVVNDIGSRLEELTKDTYLLQIELLKLESETKKVDDSSRLTAEDLSAAVRRVDELEIVQLKLGDLSSLRDRLKLLEGKIISMEERSAFPESLPDTKD
ncbi:MAG: hypothetical protein O3A65_00670 [Proteobacteria bacterium]|nr:hypothetical protein [Pseudomonadota bacterium]